MIRRNSNGESDNKSGIYSVSSDAIPRDTYSPLGIKYEPRLTRMCDICVTSVNGLEIDVAVVFDQGKDSCPCLNVLAVLLYFYCYAIASCTILYTLDHTRTLHNHPEHNV